ncbi:MAG: OmpA family protein [Bacteroidia bacterium]|nr:OmpA family protein [Bacteroidia bacterium]
MKTTGIFILLILAFNLCFAQKEKDKKAIKEFSKSFRQADDFMADNNYNAALQIFLELLDSDPDNANLQNRIGVCYLHTALQQENAITYLEKAVKNTALDAKPDLPEERRASFEVFYNLGKAFHINYKFDEAIKLFNGYLDKIVEVKDNDTLVDRANKQIEICRNAIELVKKPIQMKVENLGKNVNSVYPDYSPFVNADESVLIFTSKREESTGFKQTEDGNFYEDIYICNKEKDGAWAKAQNISSNINTDAHEASCGLSVDGAELFVYRGDGDIYSSKLIGNDWSAPQSLGSFVNSKYTEKGASMSANGNFLFFASDRPGGYGGFDIYMSKKLPNGQWGQAYNLGPNVNTEFDEIGPFFHPDASTLFFASEGHSTMGGFDVFYSTINVDEGTATLPVNIGYPINTTGDDVFLSVTPDGKRAYYSSYKNDGLGYTDICMITMKEPINKSLTVFSGITKKADTKDASNITITVTNMETQESAGAYAPNSATGKYIFILNAGKKYLAQYECDGYIPVSKTLGVNKDSTYEQLNKVMKLDSVILKKPSHSDNLLFDKKSAELNDEVKQSLQKAMDFANKNKQTPIKLNFRSGTDSKLNQKRETNIIDFLTKNGIDKSRILKNDAELKTKQVCDLTICEKEEKKEVADNNSNGNDSKNKGSEQNLNTASNLDNIKKIEIGMTVTLNNILFAVNKAYLNDAAYIELSKLLDLMQKNSNLVIEISGHTDNSGTEMHNKKLAIQRAKAVEDFLILKGIAKNRVSSMGYGYTRPMVSNDTEDGKKLNRRVEFKVIKN